MRINNIVDRTTYLLFLSLSVLPIIGYVSSTYLNISIYNLIALSSLSIFILLLIVKNNVKIPLSARVLFIFFIYTVISDIMIIGKSVSILDYLLKDRILLSFLMLIIIENISFNKKYEKNILKYLRIVLYFAVFVIIIQQFLNQNFLLPQKEAYATSSYTNSSSGRLFSIFGWTGILDVGYFFIPAYSLILFKHNIKKKSNYKVYIFILMGFLFAFLCKQRWVLLNYIIVTLFFVLRIPSKGRKFIVIILIVITLIILFMNESSFSRIFDERILEKDKGGLSEGSASTRLLAFKIFPKVFMKNALWGSGSKKYGLGGTGEHDYALERELGGRSSQLHVGYLSVLYYYGLFGGILFFIYLFILTKKLYQQATITKEWGPFFGYLTFIISNLTLVNFSIHYTGIILSVLFSKYYYDKHKYMNRLNLETNIGLHRKR